ncbi:hypothetical protein ACGFIV_32480 [Sphaerisporangium sp. NPDC049003]|uniref:hypothetical protein n=1 Tax=Sphaerisporangium sp. NPDC049003 TaxID=3364517 RepID=UPI00371524DD
MPQGIGAALVSRCSAETGPGEFPGKVVHLHGIVHDQGGLLGLRLSIDRPLRGAALAIDDLGLLVFASTLRPMSTMPPSARVQARDVEEALVNVQAVQRGLVLLQAAVAEAVLGDHVIVSARVKAMLEFDDTALFGLAKVAADFITRMSLVTPEEWTYREHDDGTQANIEDHSPPARVLTFRLLAAWSAGDTDTFAALFHAAAADLHRRGEHLRDLFDYTMEQAHRLGANAGNPHTVVRQMCQSIATKGPSVTDNW